ncbi:hypothetical protein GEV33_011468 [Tenebrio molitor]|uniref:Uncharacterized protein n=1 Tax=Tenebrio molitor TaxID=7067 RepID=A0A8J6HCS1_TENMO|nr:hypothetical protein GEV33_011468 [Tenebrio molitor]
MAAHHLITATISAKPFGIDGAFMEGPHAERSQLIVERVPVHFNLSETVSPLSAPVTTEQADAHISCGDGSGRTWDLMGAPGPRRTRILFHLHFCRQRALPQHQLRKLTNNYTKIMQRENKEKKNKKTKQKR